MVGISTIQAEMGIADDAAEELLGHPLDFQLSRDYGLNVFDPGNGAHVMQADLGTGSYSVYGDGEYDDATLSRLHGIMRRLVEGLSDGRGAHLR